MEKLVKALREVNMLITNFSNNPENFRAGNISNYLPIWQATTSDHEILSTVSGLPFNIEGLLPIKYCYQQPFEPHKDHFVKSELSALLKKGVIIETNHEKGEFISPIFLVPKPDVSFRLILNLKSLNVYVPYLHFKMDTLAQILCLVRPFAYMAKVDIKDAYYSIAIKEADTKLLKFQFHGKPYKFLALPNGYSEGPRKFTKLLKPPFGLTQGTRLMCGGLH